ncbi:fatty acyl-CoA reductase wat-like isoform X3 [Drosophila albomicans]|uniref:Fatty acyl-CoA reductase n=1 Tax=Drosophila albomicans TaxID=7291 RepID=A0A6P8XTR0_DROAB|nr:fatty acyl-CoA reductase wat-like isoform X3 [Drosophila albomicans]
MTSAIQSFYKNKTILITGGSGFLGKVTIEKLLRSTEVKRIYVLIRTKKGQEPQERIASWKDEPFFSVLLESKPDVMKKLVPIAGDIAARDIGISLSDRELLIKEVQVVFNAAATTRFTEPLHVALDTNTRPTRTLLQLAREMSRLEAFIHVSTAYCNCISFHMEERFYPEHLNCNADQALGLREVLGDKLTSEAASILMDKFPNTYTFTKALSEQIIERESGDLPVAVFRPGIVVNTYKEPVEGWIMNPYGGALLHLAAALGTVRTVLLNPVSNANILPVDYSVNMMLALGWHTATEAVVRKKNAIAAPPPPIYNYVASESNILKWGEYMKKVLALGNEFPLEGIKWFPFLICTANIWVFRLLFFFFHYLPGFFVDLVLRFRGQKPYIVKLYQKNYKQMEVLSHFGNNIWRFKTDNTNQLWNIMSSVDREVFVFDMVTMNWKDFLIKTTSGMRVYMAKQPITPESIARGRKARSRFFILHNLVKYSFSMLIAFVLWKLFRCLFYV